MVRTPVTYEAVRRCAVRLDGDAVGRHAHLGADPWRVTSRSLGTGRPRGAGWRTRATHLLSWCRQRARRPFPFERGVDEVARIGAVAIELAPGLTARCRPRQSLS
jgi:hypothetical protein